MKILIDADGCPVTDITLKLAKEKSIKAIIFCDTSHVFNKQDTQVVTVDKGADSADFALVNMVSNNDIVVTQDYGLAAMVLSKSGRPITQNGLIIDSRNIDSLLASRYESKKIRMSGKHIKGPSKRTAAQDKEFEYKLRELINS